MDIKGFFFEMDGNLEKDPNCKFPRSYPGCIQENAMERQSLPGSNYLMGSGGFFFIGNTSSFGRPLNYNFN